MRSRTRPPRRDRSDHDRARRGAPLRPARRAGGDGYVERESRVRHGDGVRGHVRAGNGGWSITPTSTAPKDQVIVRRPADPAVQRHRHRRMDERGCRGVRPRLGLPQPHAHARRIRLRRRVGPAPSASAVGRPSSGSIAGSTGVVGAEPERTARSTTRRPVRARHVRPDREHAPEARTGRRWGAEAHARRRHRGIAVRVYLTTFADAIQPRTHTFDGIFIHSRGGSGASLGGTALGSTHVPKSLRIRTDLKVPVFMFETQTDLIELGYAAAQQPNTARIRTWEVAGTSHADAYLVGAARSILGCTAPVNDGPQHIVDKRHSRPSAGGSSTAGHRPAHSLPVGEHPRGDLALDSHGDVIGGVRTPAVDVPVSTLSGAAPEASTVICSFFGSTTASASPSSSGSTGAERHIRRLRRQSRQRHRPRFHPSRRAGGTPRAAHQVQLPS